MRENLRSIGFDINIFLSMVNHTAIDQLKMHPRPELLSNETHIAGFDTTTMSPLNTTLNPNTNEKCAIATVAKKSLHV